MKFRISYLFLAIFAYLFALPAHADYWSNLKHKVENSVKNSDDDDGDSDDGDNNGNGDWVAFNGAVPENAVVGGHRADRAFIICQAPYNGGMHPGRLGDAGCTISWGGQEIALPPAGILVGDGYYWRAVDPNYGFPPDAVAGGGENGHPLFICQAPFEGGIYPGKVVGNACNIAAHGAEIQRYDFRVLCRHDD